MPILRSCAAIVMLLAVGCGASASQAPQTKFTAAVTLSVSSGEAVTLGDLEVEDDRATNGGAIWLSGESELDSKTRREIQLRLDATDDDGHEELIIRDGAGRVSDIQDN